MKWAGSLQKWDATLGLFINLLRISEGLSQAVTAEQVLGSIIMFGAIYLLLFILFIYLLDQKIRHGPDMKEEEETHYHAMEVYIDKLKEGKTEA